MPCYESVPGNPEQHQFSNTFLRAWLQLQAETSTDRGEIRGAELNAAPASFPGVPQMYATCSRFLLTFAGDICYVVKDLQTRALKYLPVCRWAGLADEHGDKLAAIDPHQSPNTKLTFLCAPWLSSSLTQPFKEPVFLRMLISCSALVEQRLATCRELESQITQFAAGLHALKLQAGDKVSLHIAHDSSLLHDGD